jgi:hypothetical protein
MTSHSHIKGSLLAETEQPFLFWVIDYVFLWSFVTLADVHAVQVMCRITYASCQSSDLLWQQLAHAYAPFGFWELAAQRSPYLSQPCLRWYDELRRLVAFQRVGHWSLEQFIHFWISQENAYECHMNNRKASPAAARKINR